MLTRQDVINVLERYLKGELPTMEMHYWGVLIEARETIEFELDYGQAINDVIRYLSEVIGEDNPLTPEMAQYWITYLRQAEKDQRGEARIIPVTENDED